MGTCDFPDMHALSTQALGILYKSDKSLVLMLQLEIRSRQGGYLFKSLVHVSIDSTSTSNAKHKLIMQL